MGAPTCGYVRPVERELTEVILAPHVGVRELLAALGRQPAVTERTLQPQLRGRRQVVDSLGRAFVGLQSVRLRYWWPEIRRLSPEAAEHADRAWRDTRGIEQLMARRQWYGEHDPTTGQLDQRIATGVEQVLDREDGELHRLTASGELALLDCARLAVRLSKPGRWPTRPHPDVPRSARLAAVMQGLLARTDLVLDRCARAG